MQWFAAYLLTCAVEIPLVVLLARGLGWRPRRALEAVAMAWALQCTHPVLWALGPYGLPGLLIAEALVVAAEGAALWWWAVRRADAAANRSTLLDALLVSFIANAASVLVGVALVSVIA